MLRAARPTREPMGVGLGFVDEEQADAWKRSARATVHDFSKSLVDTAKEKLRRPAPPPPPPAPKQVISKPSPPPRDKTKAVRLQIVDAAAYAQLVLENQGRSLSVQDAAVELGRLRAIPLPPRAGEDRV